MKEFENRRLVIASMHGKERVIAPILEKGLGVTCIVAKGLNTDKLGTFSGEMERKLDPIENAREKCLLAMQEENCDLAVASEGSFGQHPSIFFAPADDEFLVFIDHVNNLEIVARELTTKTNFNHGKLSSEEELLSFADSVGFPSHGLILRESPKEHIGIYKGIVDLNVLKTVFHKLLSCYGEVHVETDMRAMLNPTRMKVIELTTLKLLEKIQSICPGCSAPGFGVKNIKRGLRCESCGLPTRSTLGYIYECQLCLFIKEEKYPHGKKLETPMFCDFCNP